ncbi:hypothetical protein ACFL2V_14790 [Pseudomonadota bacterium]
MIENLKESNVKQCSVDLSLGEIFKIDANEVIDYSKLNVKIKSLKLPYIIKPGEYILGKTFEKINQKHTKYGIFIIRKSRTFRLGLSIESGLASPYYEGEIIFGIKNISENPIKIRKGDSLIQLVFFDIKSDIVPLNFTYQHGRIV